MSESESSQEANQNIPEQVEKKSQPTPAVSDSAPKPRPSFPRLATGIMEAGALCYLPWMTSDLLGSTERPWYITGLILLAITILLGHIAFGVLKEFPLINKWFVWTPPALIVLSLMGLVIFRTYSRSAFYVNVLTSAASFEEPWLYFVADTHGKPVTPVPIFFYLQILNKDTPFFINSYLVEHQTSDKSWHKLESIDASEGELLMANAALGHANRVFTADPPFDSVIQNKTIGPYETIQGWVFLAYPKEAIDPNKMRLRLTDSSGKESTERLPMIKIIPHTKWTGFRIGESVNIKTNWWQPLQEICQTCDSVSVDIGRTLRLSLPLSAIKANRCFGFVDRYQHGPLSAQLVNNRLCVNADIRNPLGGTVRVENYTIPTLPRGWDYNSDSNALEIVMRAGLDYIPVYQIHYEGEGGVKIRGIFEILSPGVPANLILATDAGTSSIFPTTNQMTIYSGDIKIARMFQYPSVIYPSLRDPRPSN